MKVFLTGSLVFLLVSFSDAQEIIIEQFIDGIIQTQDNPMHYEDLYETLLQYYSDPIDLNHASSDDLSNTYLFTPLQISNLLIYREKYGDFLSVYELQAVPGMDLVTIRNAIPFIQIKSASSDPRPLPERIRTTNNKYLLIRQSRILQTSKGFSTSQYQGSPDKIYGKFKTSSANDFSFGFSFEKDAGEQFQFKDRQKGFDSYSFHSQLRNKGIIDNIILGDYQIQYGQGLVFGSGFSPGKGAETIKTTARNNTGLKPYSSISESGYFRGIATTIGDDKLKTTLMFSSLLQDGIKVSDTTFTDPFINSIRSTGLHRTDGELLSRNQVSEMNYGLAMIADPTHRLSLGMSFLSTRFDTRIQKRPNNYNQFEFSGVNNQVGSAFAKWNWQNFLFYSEAAISKSGGRAIVGGLTAVLSPGVEASWLFRNYDRNFHTFYGHGFGENSSTINERGIYWGLKLIPSDQITISLFYDQFRFPWLKYQVDNPSAGHEYLGRASCELTENTSFYVQARSETKQKSYLVDGEQFKALKQVKNNYYTGFLVHQVTENVSIKSRIQYHSFSNQQYDSEGVLLSNDLNVTIRQFKLSGRYAIFDTEDYNSRLYAFERDVYNSLSFPQYSGTGIRSYVLMQYDLSKALTIWFRWAKFTYQNAREIGSGLDEIEGNEKTEIKFQIKYNL